MSAPSPYRRALLAKVHLAAKELRLDRETYGDVLIRVTGQDSAKALADKQLVAVLDAFRALGWKGAVPRRLPAKAPVRLIMALWKELRPFVRDGSPEALRAFVRRQTRSAAHPEGVDAPQFLDAKQANLVIEGLKAWLARARREAAAKSALAETPPAP